MTGKPDRSLEFPSAARRIEQLASSLSGDIDDALLLTTFTAFSGTLRFPFESPHVPFTAHSVFQSTARSEERQNSINTWLAVP